MKKLVLISIFSYLFISGLFAATQYGQQKSGTYYTVLTTTSTAISVSSTTVTTLPSVGLNGVERVIGINGAGSIFMQWGGSSTTVRTNGQLIPNTLIVSEDSYMGDIYVIGVDSTVDLRVSTRTKKIV